MLSPIERARAASELAQLAGALKAKTLPLREGLKASARAIALVDLLTGKSAPASISKAPVPFAAFVPQKDGSLVVEGDPEALTAAIKAIGGKPRPVPSGVRLTKGEARLRQFIPVRIERLPSGAQLEYHESGTVSVRGDFRGGYMGAADTLARLELLFTEDHGGAEFERIFGRPAPAEGVQAYGQQQAEIAARKADNAAREDAERLAYAKRTGDWSRLDDEEKAALKAESDATAAAYEVRAQAEWDATIGQGLAQGNKRYQAYLDTLEDIPAIGRTMVHVGYMAWVQSRLAEYQATGPGPIPYMNGAERDAWNEKATAYVRAWADEHLSERVKAQRQQSAAGAHGADQQPEGGAVSEETLIDAGLLKQWGERWKYKTDIATSAFLTANTKADAVERATAAYWNAAPEDRLTSAQRFEKANREEMESAHGMWGRLGLPELAVMYEKLGGTISELQGAAAREFNNNGGRRTSAAVAAEGAREAADVRMKLGRYIEWRLEQESAAGASAPETTPASESTEGEGVAIGDALQGVQAASEPAPLEIIEYVTKSTGKVLRGVVRHDLTYAEAKAIDKATWRMQGTGGYFIREKYLTGDIPVSDKPAQPAVQALTPEQEAERERARAEQAERQQAERKAAQVAKLREVAQATIDKAEEDLGRARLTNTARRANMAAGIAARNEKAVALGKTMLRIADAVEAGAAPRLAGVDSRATVETLQQAMANARYKAVTHETANASYQERENARHRAVRLEDLQHVEYPTARWGQDGAYNSRAKALDAIKGKRGAPALADRIRYAREIDAETYRALVKMLGKKEANSLVGWHAEEQIARAERLRRAGIPDRETLVEALRELYDLREDARKEDPVKAAERAIIGQKVGIDFFPTPAHVAQRMARLAKIGQGTRVLEPSAGNGNLADAAKAEGAEVDVCEISSQLREILTLKGFNVVDHDFMTYTPEQPYEAIIMNPPFSKRQDAEHIRRAFGMLAPGGRLVAIAGEGVFFGQDAKAVAFREWLEQHGAEVEKLDGGTFNDTSLLAQTGANARLIIIRK